MFKSLTQSKYFTGIFIIASIAAFGLLLFLLSFLNVAATPSAVDTADNKMADINEKYDLSDPFITKVRKVKKD